MFNPRKPLFGFFLRDGSMVPLEVLRNVYEFRPKDGNFSLLTAMCNLLLQWGADKPYNTVPSVPSLMHYCTCILEMNRKKNITKFF